LGEEGDIYLKLASLAPEIFGHEHVKKALLLVGAPHWTLAGGMKVHMRLGISMTFISN
jgi:DNA replicative helicase MCM subunit Mcm2 (Cdc46/Mcm family)